MKLGGQEIDPRAYQKEAAQSVRMGWDKGDPNQLVVFATGLGKTILFALIGALLRREGLRRILILSHRRELVHQAIDKWKKVDPAESLGIYMASRRDLHASVISASVASCYPDKFDEGDCPCTVGEPILDAGTGLPCGNVRLEPDPDCDTCAGLGRAVVLVREGRLRELPLAEIDLVIIDEAHHITRDSLYAQILTAIRKVNPWCLHLGVTATPFRSDNRGLGWLYQGIAHRMSIKDGIDGGWLVPLRGVRVELDLDLDSVKVSKRTGDFVDEDLGRVMDSPSAHRELVQAWIQHAGPGTEGAAEGGRMTAAFAASVDAAEHLCDAFVEAGVAAGWICGDRKRCPPEKRSDLLARYGRGEVRVLVNVGVLTEGWDEPPTACILIARPTKSKVLFIQMAGRGVRPLLEPQRTAEGDLPIDASRANGKPDCLLIDCSGATSLGLASLADLSKDEPVEVEPEPEDPDAEVDEDEPELPFPAEASTVEVKGFSAYEIDVFGGRVEWARIGGARVACVARSTTAIIFPAPEGGYSAVATRPRDGVLWLAQNVEEREALKAAEVWSVQNGVKSFLVPSAYKRRIPCTPKQQRHIGRLLQHPAVARVAGPYLTPKDVAGLSMALAHAWAGYLEATRLFFGGGS